MRLPAEMLRREGLAAPTAKAQIHIQSVVVLIVSISSLLGAGWIILNYACFKSLRSFRHQLILGLAISDFVMAADFLSSTAMNISGKYIGVPEQATFCTLNGFTTQVFVIQTDYWVLTIALCTYFILADHKRLSSWVQDHKLLLFCLPWVFSLLWAGIGLKLAGYGDIGAWCWFTSDKVRLLANFIPRWIIIAIILAMYARLYYILHRAHKSFLSFGNLSSDLTSGSRTISGGVQSNQLLRIVNDKSERTTQTLKRIAGLMLMYPIAYMLVWALPTVIRIYQTARGSPAPFALQTIDKSCIAIQGLIDAVIYGLNEAALRRWRDLLFPSPFPTINGVGAGRPDSTHHPRRRSIPPSCARDQMPNDSTSSLETIPSRADSVTRITGISTSVESKGLDGNIGVELTKMSEYIERNAGNSGGIIIHKTIEVNVTSRTGD